MRTTSSPISAVLFGQTRGAVLALLYGHPDEAFYLRQIARQTQISPGAVQRELEQLLHAGLVTRSELGSQVFYRANAASPVFSEIRSLVLKTVGIAGVLQAALEPLSSAIRIAFVYGSVARREENASSDVDLMIIGRASLDEVLAKLSRAEVELGREINPTTYGVREFKKRVAEGNHFLTSVMQQEKLFLIGSEHELRSLGSKRVA